MGIASWGGGKFLLCPCYTKYLFLYAAVHNLSVCSTPPEVIFIEAPWNLFKSSAHANSNKYRSLKFHSSCLFQILDSLTINGVKKTTTLGKTAATLICSIQIMVVEKKKKKTKTQSITDYKAEKKQTNIWVALRLVLVFLLNFQN